MATMAMEGSTHYGDDDVMRWVEVTPDKSGIVVYSEIKKGIADRFEGLLRDNPGVRTVHLWSYGGLADEGHRIANLVRAKGLDTTTDGPCFSACTIIHAAGRLRLVADRPNPLGYHSAGLVGIPAHWNGLGTTARDIYESAGFERSFVDRIETVPHYDIWEPRRDVLLGAGAIHGVVDRDDKLGLGWLLRVDSAQTRFLVGRGLRETGDAMVDRGFLAGAFAKAPLARAIIADWSSRAWKAGRNDYRANRHRRAYAGRMVARAMSIQAVPDRVVRKVGLYLLAGMQAVRNKPQEHEGPGDLQCARMGSRADLVTANKAVSNPPDSASHPDDPWGALFGNAFDGLPDGWDAGLAPLPDADDTITWIAADPVPAESCEDLVRWYAAAIDYDDPEGIRRLRERFAAIASPAPGKDLLVSSAVTR